MAPRKLGAWIPYSALPRPVLSQARTIKTGSTAWAVAGVCQFLGLYSNKSFGVRRVYHLRLLTTHHSPLSYWFYVKEIRIGALSMRPPLAGSTIDAPLRHEHPEQMRPKRCAHTDAPVQIRMMPVTTPPAGCVLARLPTARLSAVMPLPIKVFFIAKCIIKD